MNLELEPRTAHQNRATLVADIGGTHARFGWQRMEGAPVTQVATLPCSEFETVEDAVSRYLRTMEIDRPTRFALGVASPVTGDEVKMTNNAWSISVPRLKTHLGSERGLLMNDFAALAYAVPALATTELRALGRGVNDARGPIGVIGPGTGLGVASLIPTEHDDFIPVPGEGGHVTLAPTTAREAEVLAVLRERFGHASAERAVSGPGLRAIRDALCILDKQSIDDVAPYEIGLQARAQSNEISVETVKLFTSFLGGVAGNLALTLGAFGGIYIGGGVVAKLGDAFDTQLFRAKFEEKGRFATYLSKIPTLLITHETPALLGAARYAERVFGKAAM